MTFDEILTAVVDLLQRQGRVSYRALKLRFQLDEEFLAGIKDELIDAQRVAQDEDEKVLVWVGDEGKDETAKAGKGEDSPESRHVQSPESKIHNQETQPPTPNPQPPVAERRQLTVMFCDLVGSTALSAQLDPEELRDVVRGYQETCTTVIRRYEGHIAQHLGDGLLVYFGYPTAHEDDAARAVRAGLEIIQAMREQVTGDRGQKKQEPLHVRIGIHTGLVVIGEIGSSEKREMLALGETPNIAARIQGLAAPDEVLISAATYRLVEGLFDTEDRGRPELKGVATPLTVYRVVKESDAHSRFDVVVRKGLTPLIGREHEFGLLRERWERVKDGTGQVVLLSGEPGIGKSRLVEALKENVEHEGTRFWELRCSPYTQNSALAPVIELVQRVLQFQPAETADAKLHKLEQRLARSSLNLQEIVPLFAALLSLPAARYPIPALSPQKQKEKTHEALVAWLCAEATHQAVTYAWEDLHWADPSTLELLTLFLAQVPTTRLFTVLTFRPEFTPPWGAHSYLSQLSLSRLGRKHVETMVAKVTGGHALPTEVLQQIVSKTDGVPLFVEELTKTVLESGSLGVWESRGTFAQSAMQFGIPTTLQDALMARLDRLGAAKEIAQLGATLGREFTYELLKAISPLNEDSLQRGLKQLVDSELVYQRGTPPHASYIFKHALIQDTAYQSILKSRRQQLHQQIAQILEEQFPDTKNTQPELLAHHYTEAGLIEQAIPYWQHAGQDAAQRSANVEAISHLTKGLELLKNSPDTPGRPQQELALQLALSNALMATKGYAAPEVEKVYVRAFELCQKVGETSQLFPVLVGLWRFYVSRAEYKTAHELGEQCLNLAQQVHNPVRLLGAHQSLGVTLFCLGEFTQARVHLEQAIALYDPQKRHFHASRSGQDPGVACLVYVAWTLWALGYPDQAQRRSHEALTLAQALSHPLSLAQALVATLRLHQYSWEWQVVQGQSEALLTLSTEHQFAFVLAWGTIMRGLAVAAQGQWEEGIVEMRQGLAAYRSTGAEAILPYYLACLAEAYGQRGQTEQGLKVLAEALATVNKTEEREYEAELYRLKGELTLQTPSGVRGPESEVTNDPASTIQSPESEAEECFLKALEIARHQQAKSLELRASTSLARLWQSQGKRAEAHKLLSDVYNWFTEGFDTKDLHDAKALLEALGR